MIISYSVNKILFNAIKFKKDTFKILKDHYKRFKLVSLLFR